MLFREGNTDGAIAQFRMAIAENPYDIKARNNLGVLLEQTGDAHGAIEQYQAVLQIDPANKLIIGCWPGRWPKAAISTGPSTNTEWR